MRLACKNFMWKLLFFEKFSMIEIRISINSN